MVENRQYIENRILEILTYIGANTLAFPLKQNISLFSLKELKQLLEFLETGNLEPIYKFLDEKYKEYLAIIEEIKVIKIGKKINKKKEEEIKERENEEKKLDLLLNF